MRRKQQELPLYAGYSAPPGQGYGTHPSSIGTARRPVTQGGGNGAGRLPSIFDKPTNVVLPVGVHQQEATAGGLGLDIKAMPAMGSLPLQTVPRLHQGAADRMNMLSSSDTTSDRLRQARKGYIPSGHSGGEPGTGEEPTRHGRRRFSQPNVVIGPLSASRRGSRELDEQRQQMKQLSGRLRVLEGGSKTKMAASDPLPPIAVKRDSGNTSDEEINEDVGVDQVRSESSISDETDETDEEVCL